MAKKKTTKSELKSKKCMLCTTTVPRVEDGHSIICWECTQLICQGRGREEVKQFSRQERDKIFVK